MPKMKVLSKLKSEPGLWLREAEVPVPEANDVLIKIKKTAICGTDLHIYNWDAWAQKTIPVPMHVGHEFVGEIVALGSSVEGLKKGMRVSGEGHIVCGHCRNCRIGKRHLCRNTLGVGVHRDGAFAEYLALPATNVIQIPDEIDDDVAAILDPLGNAVHTALSFNLVGEDVLISGAGPIGIMAAAVCRHVGARYVTITDINEYRLNHAAEFGCTNTVNVSDCSDMLSTTKKLQAVMQSNRMHEGYDVGLEMSGHPTAIASMCQVMNTGGKIASLGLTGKTTIDVHWDEMVFKGLLLKGIYGREMYNTWYQMLAMLQAGLNIKPIITHVFAANEFEQAFQVMRSGECGKVILDWSDV
jgi:threonine 3-dehydrogenase